MKVVLSVSGSDSGGGAGIQADLKTFHRFGVFGTSVLTLVTAQNTQTVTQVLNLSPELVWQQLVAVSADFPLAAGKVGDMANAEVARTVARFFRTYPLHPLVVDPVMISKHGAPLLEAEAIPVVREAVLPLADLVTPNLPELAALVGREVNGEDQIIAAGEELAALGPLVLVKGGHRTGPEAVDILLGAGEPLFFSAPRIDSTNTHGTGCTFSAAITAFLALGQEIPEAIREAKAYITRAIETAPGLGSGYGPLNHWA